MASFWISSAQSRIQSFPRLYYMGRDIDHFHKSWCIYYSLALVLIKSTGWLWFKYSFEFCPWPELSTLPDNPGDSRFWTVFPSLLFRVWNFWDKLSPRFVVFCDTCHLCKQLNMTCSCGAYIDQSQWIFFSKNDIIWHHHKRNHMHFDIIYHPLPVNSQCLKI